VLLLVFFILVFLLLNVILAVVFQDRCIRISVPPFRILHPICSNCERGPHWSKYCPFPPSSLFSETQPHESERTKERRPKKSHFEYLSVETHILSFSSFSILFRAMFSTLFVAISKMVIKFWSFFVFVRDGGRPLHLSYKNSISVKTNSQ